MKQKQAYILAMLMLLITTLTRAQENVDNGTDTLSSRSSISMRADSIFRALKPQIDSTYLTDKELATRGFGTRFSFHTNMVDWAMTLPNIGLEFDLRRSSHNLHRNRRSLFFNIKYNGSTKENHRPKYVFNYMQLRAEYRKYWRTGNIGRERDYPEFKRINLHKPDSHYEQYKKAMTIPKGKESDTQHYGFEELNAFKDSLFANYGGDPNRSWIYNHWKKIRRRVSTRTVIEPRNWRAYFIGLYAMADKYSFCLGKKGRQGTGLGVGMSAGWSIPLLPQRYPKMGGLDLDLGVSAGLRMVRDAKYRYDGEFRDYQCTKPASGFKVVPFPLIDEVRIALVYRFRSIGNKVDLALVDKYKKEIDRFEERRKAKADTLINRRLAWEYKQEDIRKQQAIVDDSLSFWQPYHKRRLKNAWALNPDTIFHDRDSLLEQELFPDSVKARIERKIAAQKAAKEAAKLKKEANKEAKRMAKEAAKAAKAAKKEEEVSETSEASEESGNSENSENPKKSEPAEPAKPEEGGEE